MPTLDEHPNITASVFDRLIDDDPRVGTPLLDRADLKSPSGLAAKLRAGEGALSSYLVQQLPPETQAALLQTDERAGAVSEDLLQALIDGINRIIHKPCIYEHRRFAEVKLSRETRQSVESVVPGAPTPFVNRTLLDEAYPDEILKRRRESTQYTVRQMKDHVARDLGTLLNTRRELLTELPEAYKEVPGTLVEYGLPDFTSFSLVNVNDQKRIRRSVEHAVASFEPRLTAVRVSVDLPERFDQVLRFRIDALLRLDPTPEPVSFDATLHLMTGEYHVRN